MFRYMIFRLIVHSLSVPIGPLGYRPIPKGMAGPPPSGTSHCRAASSQLRITSITRPNRVLGVSDPEGVHGRVKLGRMRR